ncbi:ABC transporter ATP-binding protein [Streptomyces sp. AHU1]|uniref:ABC transporter ATP-binding protein n=1 Tax=Streptomyces sp. AHU1 TaxID=3377215 RepID=UPI003878041D
MFGFVGSNGAGRTTTTRIAPGVLAAEAGEVRRDGSPVTLKTRSRIGHMPEERGLYPRMRVGEQLEYLARLHGLSRTDAARTTREWTGRLGVDGRVGDEVQRLSLGDQQRVQFVAGWYTTRRSWCWTIPSRVWTRWPWT